MNATNNSQRLNPLKRVNSILTNRMNMKGDIVRNVSIPSSGSIQFLLKSSKQYIRRRKSQSPQAGQFNSYKVSSFIMFLNQDVSIPSSGSIQFLPYRKREKRVHYPGLNPLKRVNSILTGSELYYSWEEI